MIFTKKKASHRISVWVLVFALLLSVVASTMVLQVGAKNFLDGAREATSDVGDGLGEAVSDVGDAVSEAVTELTHDTDGVVNDSDAVIGNESDEAGTDTVADEDDGGMGWLGLVIALVVVLIVVVLIIILVPKKKH